MTSVEGEVSKGGKGEQRSDGEKRCEDAGKSGRKRERLMRKWGVGGNQRDGEMKERTSNGGKRGRKAHRQIAVARVRSPEAAL